MSRFLDTAMDWLATTLEQSNVAGETVDYQRGSESVSVTAVVGASDMERSDGDGAQVAFRSTDFIITASTIILAGFVTQPRRGDKIIRTVGSTRRTHEVLPVDGEQHFAYSDPTGKQYRIHTKLIREEPA